MNLTEEEVRALDRKWKYYIGKGNTMPETDPDVRDFVYESWKRSKAHNIKPDTVKDKQLPPLELQKRIEKNSRLISVAHSYMERLYTFVKGTNIVLALTDDEGYVLDMIKDDRDSLITGSTIKSGLMVGSCRSEAYAGTNGIGTCLVEGRPLQIWGKEHYIVPHHDYVCSAAPIRDLEHKIIGCLDAIGPLEIPHNHTLAMVCAAADGIEKELKMRAAYASLEMANHQVKTAFETIDKGIIIYDNIGRISQYNERMCKILKLSDVDMHGTFITDYLDLEAVGINLLNIKKNMENREITLITKNGLNLSVTATSATVYNENMDRVGTVLVLEETKDVHRLVNRVGGFSARYTFDSIIGESPVIIAAKEMGKIAARSNSNVLLLGESGTGKELMAQSIHNASSHADGPFISINCGSIPKSLIESELFGYDRGAFTGANREGNPGKFELANGGTIFLDEIGDMPLELQASLLHVIQTREVMRIGGTRKKVIDVRIIAATNVNLYDAVQKKEFREDLYYRLNVLSIEIPPLRNRQSDVSLLCRHYMEKVGRALGKVVEISPAAMEILENYSWPGNIRELENTIERAVNLTTNDMITPAVLPAEVVEARREKMYNVESGEIYTEDSEREAKSYRILAEALSKTRGNVSKASELLGIPKRTLYRRIKKFDIDVDEYRLL